jgi:hypothetical protein
VRRNLDRVSAIGLAAATADWIARQRGSGRPRANQRGGDRPTVLFTLGLVVLVTAACSVIPSLRIGHGSLSLGEDGRKGTARRAAAAAQIALALVALARSALLLHAFPRLHGVRAAYNLRCGARTVDQPMPAKPRT